MFCLFKLCPINQDDLGQFIKYVVDVISKQQTKHMCIHVHVVCFLSIDVAISKFWINTMIIFHYCSNFRPLAFIRKTEIFNSSTTSKWHPY